MVVIFIIAVRSQPIFLIVSFVARDPLSSGNPMGRRPAGRRVRVLDTLLREVHGAIFLWSCGHFVDAPRDGESEDAGLLLSTTEEA
jgi:hypothetical protein